MKKLLLLLGMLLWGWLACAQLAHTVMFYNVENYFDCKDDTLTNDDEFLPHQGKFWNHKRMAVKRQNIARVIAAVGQGQPPVLVGLCEVENNEVVRQLVRYKPLSAWQYDYVHFESPDARGIDVTLLYQPSWFTPLKSQALPVSFTDGSHSRDILYVKGLLLPADTLHVLVCHAPSRRGGAAYSAARRAHAMGIVRQVIDSVCALQPRAKMLVMGDFNDTPRDASIASVLGAVVPAAATDTTRLLQLMNVSDGTYKYKSEWSLFDQLMVTPYFLTAKGWHVKDQQAYVYKGSFLLQEDATHMGYKPYRTYLGPRYIGGYSDHLPVYLQLTQ